MSKNKPKDDDVLCEDCGKRIPKTRLKAVPDARFCVKCQEKNEESDLDSSAIRTLPDDYDTDDLIDTITPDE